MIYLLRVFTFGLIAYVTGGSGEIRLLLLDVRHPPVATDGCPIHAHEPLLLTRPEKDRCRASAGCTPYLGLCRCPLDREQVSFTAVSFAAEAKKNHHEMDYVPGVQTSFLSRLRQVREDCLFRDHDQPVCPFVVAEAQLLPQQVYTCEMARGHGNAPPPRSGDRTQKGMMFFFRSASQEAVSASRRQHVAIKQVLVQELDPAGLTPPNDPLSPITVRIVPYDRTERAREVWVYPEKCPGDAAWMKGKGKQEPKPTWCYDLAIVNLPIHANQHLLYGRCQDHGLDRDFELFEDLARTRQDLEDREVPFDRGGAEPDTLPRNALCDAPLLDDLNNYLRTDQATSECSGGRIKK